MAEIVLELEDIQRGVLRPRPAPYAATYVLFRIDDRSAGRELMRRLRSVVDSAKPAGRSADDTWVSVALSYQGLKKLGVPQASLDSFSIEFRQGMAARAKSLGDSGESSPERWEKPLGSTEVHVVITAVAPGVPQLEAAFARARKSYQELKGVTAIWRQDCHVLPGEREAFGFKDGISHPAIEGSGIPGTNPHELPLKPGEFVLGYPDEMSEAAADTAARCPRTQRKLRCLSQAAPARRRVSPVLEDQHLGLRGRGIACRENDGAVAKRSSTGALSHAR